MMTPNTKATEKFRIRGDWTQLSKLLKAKYSQLTDADLQLESGQEEDLLFRMERRLSRNRDGVVDIIKELELSIKGTTL